MGLVQLLYNRWSDPWEDRGHPTIPALAEDKLEWLKAKASDGDSSDIAASWYGNFSWALMYDNEMRIAGQLENADQHFKDHIAKVLQEKDLKQAVSLSALISNQGDDEQLWAFLELLRSNPKDPLVSQRWQSVNLNASCLGMFTSQQRIEKKLSQGPAGPKYRERVMTLLEGMLAEEANKPIRRSSIRLTSVGQPRSSYIQVGSSYEQVVISFPPQGIGPDDSFIQNLWTMNSLFKEYAGALTKPLSAEDPDADPR